MRDLHRKNVRICATILSGGIRERMHEGKVCLNCTQFLGYDKDENGRLVIVKSKADIVRKIFQLYLNGFGVREIKKYLEENGIKTVTRNDIWSTSNIERILSNEKNMQATCLCKRASPRTF